MKTTKKSDGITQRKDGLYMGRFMFNGKRHTMYDKDKKALKKRMNDMRYELEHGIYGSPEKMDLNHWFEAWLEEYKKNQIKETVQQQYKTLYNAYIRKELGKMKLQEIRAMHIQKLFNKMLTDGYSIGTVTLIKKVLHNMMNVAIENEILFRNPCKGTKLPKNETESVFLAEQQRTIFFQEITHSKHEDLYRLILGTGLRIGEALALNWDDIDFDNKTLSVDRDVVYKKLDGEDKAGLHYQTPKSYTSIRCIPLNTDIIRVLENHRKEQRLLRFKMGSEWKPLEQPEAQFLIFAKEDGTPFLPQNIYYDLDRLVETYNKRETVLSKEENREPFLLERIRPHQLRHTYATICFENGIPMKTVQTLLGHAGIQITADRYTHITEEKQKEDIKILDGMFMTS